ncbi:MAG: hypothetical protein EU530_07400 [Promethearchaeota archaeon]|nr:MAG: hypothetical protein EU530_07400 [Candidatus Lokiarchaeota archaeon]
MSEKIRVKAAIKSSKILKPRDESKEKNRVKDIKGANISREKSYLDKTDIRDSYFFYQDKTIPKTERKGFETFFKLKKMINEKTEIRNFFESYGNASSHGIFRMKFTQKFIEHTKNHGQNLPITHLELLNMLEKINSGNEIYNYLATRIKQGLRAPTKEVGRSVLAGSRNASRWMNEIRKDLRTRNEIATLGGSVGDSNFVNHWDNFVTKTPLSANDQERSQKFVEYLKRFRISENFIGNEQNFEKLIHWAENKINLTKNVGEKQIEIKEYSSIFLKEKTNPPQKIKEEPKSLVQSEKIQVRPIDWDEIEPKNQNKQGPIDLTRTRTKEETMRDLENYNLTYKGKILQPSNKTYENLNELNQVLSVDRRSNEIFKFKTKCFNLQFTSKFIEHTKEKTKLLSSSNQKLPKLLEKINSNNEFYNYFVKEIKSGQNRTPTEISKKVFVDRHIVKRYLEEIGNDLHIRNNIQVIGESMDEPHLVNYWDKYVSANPLSKTPHARYVDFASFLMLSQDNHESVFGEKSESVEKLIQWAEFKAQYTTLEKIEQKNSSKTNEAISQQNTIKKPKEKKKVKNPLTTVIYKPNPENREFIVRKPNGVIDKIRLGNLLENSPDLQILSIDKSERGFGKSKFVNVKNVQKNYVDETINLSLEDGRILTCSPNQLIPIYRSNVGGKRTERQIIEIKADELKLGDEPLVLHTIPLNEKVPESLSIFNLLEEEDIWVGMTREEFKKFSYRSTEQTDDTVIELINKKFTYSKVAKMYKCKWSSLNVEQKNLVNEEIFKEKYTFEVKIGEEAGKWHSPLLNLSKGFFKLMGWYVAEGSIGSKKNHLNLSQSKKLHSKNYQDIIKIIEELDLPCSFDNKKTIRINSNIYTRIMNNFCSKGAYNKKIPWKLFTKERADAFLESYYNGDGNLSAGKWKRYSTVSEQLKNDLLTLKGALGTYASVQNPKSTDNIFRIIETDGRLYKRKHHGEINFNGTTPVRIKNIEKIKTIKPQIVLETDNGWYVTTNGIIVSWVDNS